ncbi:unnamed protein product, partial [Allacma fusca]
MIVSEDVSMHKLMQQQFDTDAFGVRPNLELMKDSDTKQAERLLQETTQLIGSKYETGLLWVSDEMEFNSGYEQAFNRLINLENRLKRAPELSKVYQQKLDEYFQKGYARPVQVVGKRKRYFPHFPVTNPNKVGKIRLVHDAAAKVQGKSLNDYLLAGPDLYRP